MSCLQRLAARIASVLILLCSLPGCENGPHVLYGFMDVHGRWVVAPNYDDALPFSEGLAAVRHGAKWGYVDATGRRVIELRFSAATPFSEGVAAVAVGEGQQFIDPSGSTVIAGPFERAFPFHGGLAAVQIGGQWGFIDRSGAVIVTPQFDEIDERTLREFDWTHLPCFSEGLCAARAGELWGYINRSGAWAIAPRFEQASWFREGLAAVRVASSEENAKTGFIDRRGHWIIEPRFESALWFSGGRAIAMVGRPPANDAPAVTGSQKEDGNGNAAAGLALSLVLIDAAGREVAELLPQAEELSEDDLLAAYISIWPDLDYFADGLVPAHSGGQWGYRDRHGEWLIKPRFDVALPFRHGVAVVGIADSPPSGQPDSYRIGTIDTQGRWLIEPQAGLGLLHLQGAAFFHAHRHDRWGLLDRDGGWRIPPRFADKRSNGFLSFGFPNSLSEGLIRMGVYANHQWLVADVRGRHRPAQAFQWLKPLVAHGAAVPLLAYMEDSLWGLSDANMRRLTDPVFDDTPVQRGQYLDVTRDGLKGCLDLRGRWIVPAEFDEIVACGSEGIIARRSMQWGRWSAAAGWQADEQLTATRVAQQTATREEEEALYAGVNAAWHRQDDHWVLKREGELDADVAPVDEVSSTVMRGWQHGQRRWRKETEWLSKVRRGAAWGVLDRAGQQVLPLRYEAIGSLFDGLFAVQRDGLWGIAEIGGREVFRATHERLEPFSREVAVFCQASRCGLVGHDGAVILAPEFTDIEPLSDRLALAVTSDTDGEERRFGIIDSAGRVRVEPVYRSIREFSASLWLAEHPEHGTQLLTRATGAPVGGLPRIERIEHELTEGLAAASFRTVDGYSRAGYIDATGRLIIPARFSSGGADRFRGGAAVVSIGDKCGAIDRRGGTVLPIEFDHCMRLADGRIVAGIEAGAP